MIYNVMDPQLIEINSIKDISYIKFYDLVKNDGNKRITVPTLMINYDGNKLINLSILDKYFNIYVNKVIEVYKRENKERVDEDSTLPFDSRVTVTIDSRTKEILDKADIVEKKEITSFYDNKDSFSNSLMYEADEVKSIMDITRYMISEFSKFANLNLEFQDGFKGYRTNYVMEAKINDILTYLLIHYDKLDDNNYEVSVGNLGGVNKPLIINISFTDDSVYIKATYQDVALVNEYKVNSKNGYFIKQIFKDGDLVKYEPGTLNKTDVKTKNLVNFDSNIEYTWYELPWVAYLGYSGSEERIDDNTRIYTNNVIYYDESTNSFYKREFYTKKLKRDNTNTTKGILITLDELRKIVFGYFERPYFIIETQFRSARGDGEYQEKYDGNYFYHVIKARSLDNITKDKLVSVKKEFINDKSDLLSDVKMKRIGGRQ